MLYGQATQVKYTNPNPRKTALLRLPTSAEMIDRIKGQKTVRKLLGRGKATSELLIHEEADLSLFGQLRIDKDGVEFSAAEARAAIQTITQYAVEDCEPMVDAYRITLKTPFGNTVHTVGDPLQKDLFEYHRNSSRSIELRHGREELAWQPEAGVKLYDAVIRKSEGYAEGVEVPPHHKCGVAAELAQAIAEQDPQLDIGPNS